MKNGWLHANVRNAQMGRYWFGFTFYYFDGSLRKIDFELNDDKVVGGWDDWSEAEEMRLLKIYENWLYQQTGTTETRFSWGQVRALYDSKG